MNIIYDFRIGIAFGSWTADDRQIKGLHRVEIIPDSGFWGLEGEIYGLKYQWTEEGIIIGNGLPNYWNLRTIRN